MVVRYTNDVRKRLQSTRSCRHIDHGLTRRPTVIHRPVVAIPRPELAFYLVVCSEALEPLVSDRAMHADVPLRVSTCAFVCYQLTALAKHSIEPSQAKPSACHVSWQLDLRLCNRDRRFVDAS